MDIISQPRMPVHLWIEAKIRELTMQGIGVYVTQKGERNDGTVLLKIADCKGKCKLLIQQRNLDGALEWMKALNADVMDEGEGDSYIRRSMDRDPDQWVIEVESPEMDNPFIEI
jgi:hypothetical protein